MRFYLRANDGGAMPLTAMELHEIRIALRCNHIDYFIYGRILGIMCASELERVAERLYV